jgi:hypothetical protein
MMMGGNVKQNGYFTVEAALILPVVLWIFLFLIYQMLFQYDRCLMEQDIGIIALRGSMLQQEKKELLTSIQNEYGKINQHQYVMLSRDEPHFIVSGGKITVEGGGSLMASLPPFIHLAIPSGLWKTESSFTNNRINPVLFIRTCQKVAGAWNSF